MSFLDIDWLPPAIGFGVGVGDGVLAASGADRQSRFIAPLYRLSVFGFGLFRELRAQPGAVNPVSVDVNYSLMSAALGLEGNLIPGVFRGKGIGSLTGAPMVAKPAHAHGASCNTCASRKPVVAAPLLTPAASLHGYHDPH